MSLFTEGSKALQRIKSKERRYLSSSAPVILDMDYYLFSSVRLAHCPNTTDYFQYKTGNCIYSSSVIIDIIIKESFFIFFTHLISYCLSKSGFFSPILRLQEQQNFRNLEFRRGILEFSKKSFHFDGGNLDFPLSSEQKS